MASSPSPTDQDCSARFLPAGSQASKLILDNDWSTASLGGMDQWPGSLVIPLGIALNCAIPTLLWHGPELTTFFNDPALTILGPCIIGLPAREAFAHIWDKIGPALQRVMITGKPASVSCLFSVPESANTPRCFDLLISPIRDELGNISGAQGLLLEQPKVSSANSESSLERLARDQRLSAFLEHSTVLGFLKDATGRYEYLSPTFQKRYNVRPEDWLGKTDFEIWPESIARKFVAADRAALEKGQYVEVVESAPDPNGEEVWWLTHKFVFQDALGQTHVGGLSVDITARKLAEEALKASEEKRKIGAAVAGLALAEVDYKTDSVHLSNEAALMFGLGETARTLPRAMVHATFHPEDRTNILSQIQAALEPGSTGWFDMDVRILLPEGSLRWLRVRTQVVFDGEGALRRPRRAMLAMLDVTAEKTAEDALRESENRFRAISEMNPDAILVSVEGRYVYANRAAVELLEARDADEIVNLTPFDIVAPAFYDLLRRRLKSAVEENHIDPLREYQWVKRTGELVDVEVATGPITWLGKHGVQAVARNITSRKQAEAALRDADRRKDRFLATLAHELRNPLAPISNGVDLLLKTETSADTFERRHHLLMIMKRQVGHLVRLVDDLLEISRISHGKIELRKEPVDCSAVIRTAIETSQSVLDIRAHHLTLNLPTERLTVKVDPVRLAQVISNLIINAANYTQREGQIQVSLRKSNDQAVISIRDNGIGISSEMLPKVFEIFTQVSQGAEGGQSGLGIGLALARQLVELHGGRITARSDGVGCGSEFVVHLPLELA